MIVALRLGACRTWVYRITVCVADELASRGILLGSDEAPCCMVNSRIAGWHTNFANFLAAPLSQVLRFCK
jgi:hypothetical protein